VPAATVSPLEFDGCNGAFARAVIAPQNIQGGRPGQASSCLRASTDGNSHPTGAALSAREKQHKMCAARMPMLLSM
jgi:hypothetical protein